MRRTGTGTRRGPDGDKPPGFVPNARCVRGHLIGSQFGGLGTYPRNIVTLHESANRHMLQTERQIAKFVARGIRVNYRVVPTYGNGTNAQPTAIRMIAFGRGMPVIYREIQNPRCY